MDIEWAKDGRTGELFIVQARPETVHAQRDPLVLERFQLEARGEVLATGPQRRREDRRRARRASSASSADLEQLQPGEVLVTEMTDPDWEPMMKRAAAIVTDRGGRTCHAAIVSRELGIPAIVGTGDGHVVDHDGRRRSRCRAPKARRASSIAAGCRSSVERTNLADLPRPRTQHHAERRRTRPRRSRCRSCPNDGVGLARIEFIISDARARRIRWRCCDPDRSPTPKQRREIERLTRGYADKGAVLRRSAGRRRRA